ncbi:MAG: replicative DNA helicase [Dysgonamonadaceae bacterium]|jgi:replicative DNA helicase|nr:replicative DNA helicase [Dysgonamonadaceae bacterium]
MAKKTEKPEKQAQSELSGRIPPQDRGFEEAVLGALMIEKDAFSTITESEIPLKPDCFYDNNHKLIFEAILELAARQRPIDILTVADQMRKNGTLEQVGGASFISELSQKVVSTAHLEYHARIITQKYLARELIKYSANIENKAFDETNDVDELMQEAEKGLFELAQNNLRKDFTHIDPVVTRAVDLIHEAAKKGGEITGIPTGFTALDEITLGWQPSDLIIIAARPSMGKTALVLSMAKNMTCDYKIPVAFFSLEMADIQLVNRLIVNLTELDSNKIKSGKLSEEEWLLLDKKLSILREAPFYIDETPGLSIFDLRSKARRLVREHGVKCIIIDYLQLMNANREGVYDSKMTREREVALISSSLKGLAKELHIPVIALSQMNRSVENRPSKNSSEAIDSKRPQLSDLRESGGIEQDADIVCFIHRPDYYQLNKDQEGNELTGLAKIIIAKHRNGATCDVDLQFIKRFARFQNIGEGDPMSFSDPMSYIDKPSKANGKNHSNFTPYSTSVPLPADYENPAFLRD